MGKISGNLWSKLPREIRDMIYTNVLSKKLYVIVNHERSFRPRGLVRPEGSIRGPVYYCLPKNLRPPYLDLLLASKQIATELVEVLYKRCMFRAYLCGNPRGIVTFPCPGDFPRFQRIEFVLDLHLAPTFVSRPDGPGRSDVYYREWLEAFGSSGDFCRVKILNIILRDFNKTPVYRQFLSALKRYTSFRTVILELGEELWLPREAYFEDAGPVGEATYAGEKFETLKKTIATELEPALGPCIYYNRGLLRCLEFRPCDDQNPIEPGQAPFIEWSDE